MNAEIISIGNELLSGQVVNTNAAFVAEKLAAAGIPTVRITAISDREDAIAPAIGEAMQRSALVITTGGLGPTSDDITKGVLCRIFGCGLRRDRETLAMIRAQFDARGWDVSQVNMQQADVPEPAVALRNPTGTAPGIWLEKEATVLVCLPGVPFEMENILQNEVIPRLRKKERLSPLYFRTALISGIGESALAEKISDWEKSQPRGILIAYLPEPGIVKLRLSQADSGWTGAEEVIQSKFNELHHLIPDLLWGYDNDSLEQTVGRMLTEHGLSLATAESCTGGYVAHLITSVPGSSRYFKASLVAYHNDVKINELRVDPLLIVQHGAVSSEVVTAMAAGAKEKFSVDYAIATSGVAGPDGGTAAKPVGTVWISVAGPAGTRAECHLLGNHRGRNIRRASLATLNMLRKEVLKVVD